MIYAISTVYFFRSILVEGLGSDEDLHDHIFMQMLGLQTVLLLLYQFRIEMRQTENSFKEYINSLTNILDLVQYISTGYIVSSNMIYRDGGNDMRG